MKNWRIPTVILGLLIVAIIFRWGDLGSATNNGTTIKTKADHWNGSVWQVTIKNGSYSERMISSGWIESSRKPIDKQVEYQETIYTPKTLDTLPKSDPLYGKTFKFAFADETYVTKTKTIQEPPVPLYWISSNGLFKIWLYITLVIGIWFIVTVVITGKKRNKTIEM